MAVATVADLGGALVGEQEDADRGDEDAAVVTDAELAVPGTPDDRRAEQQRAGQPALDHQLDAVEDDAEDAMQRQVGEDDAEDDEDDGGECSDELVLVGGLGGLVQTGHVRNNSLDQWRNASVWIPLWKQEQIRVLKQNVYLFMLPYWLQSAVK